MCFSGLKARHRDEIMNNHRNAKLVMLMPSQLCLEKRLQERESHFIDPSLLSTQLETVELPIADEKLS